MGHSVSRIIEGGLSEQTWMNHVFAVRPNVNKDTTQSTGNDSHTDEESNHHHDDEISQLYRRWIFLHSTLLRTVPFTMEQQIQLRIQLPFPSQEEITRNVDDDDHIMENNNVDDDLCLIFPHAPFVGIPKSPIFQRLLRERPPSTILMNSHDNNTAPLPPPLRMKLNDFGHLGPTFRGRDLIRSQTIFASSPACTVVAFESWTMAAGGLTHNNATNGRVTNPFFEAWRQGRDDGVLWILQLHREAYKATPLTVEPHIITIKK